MINIRTFYFSVHVLALLALLGLVVAPASVPAAHAQAFGRVGDFITSGTSYHVFVEPGEATVQVQVLGSVGGPGLYEIGVGTDLGRLLALTGGLQFISENPNIRRSVEVRVYRLQDGRRTVIYEAPYEEVLQEPAQYPTLRDEDVIVIEATTRQRFTWRNAIGVVGSIAGIVLVLDRLFRFLPRRR